MDQQETALEVALEEEPTPNLPSPPQPSIESSDPSEWPKKVSEQELFHIHTVIYGAPGVGKTRTAATAPRPFILECDPAGALSLQDQDILYWQISTMQDFRNAWIWLMDHLDDFDTIVVDGMKRFQSMGLDEIIDPTVLEVTRKVWGKSSRQMRSTIERLSTFPHNVVFCCGERLRDDQITHLKVLVPSMTPSAASLLNESARLVGRLFIDRYQNLDKSWAHRTCLQVENDGRAWAKDSSGKLPSYIYEPNLTEIFAVMQGKEVEDLVVPESEPSGS